MWLYVQSCPCRHEYTHLLHANQLKWVVEGYCPVGMRDVVRSIRGFPSSTLRQTRITIHLIYQCESRADVQITNPSRRLLMELYVSIGIGEELKTQRIAFSLKWHHAIFWRIDQWMTVDLLIHEGEITKALGSEMRLTMCKYNVK